MRILVGTSGYSYKEWKGSFYPERFPEKEMLRFYAGRFPTVEINNTFYRMPTESMLQRWSSEVPESFAFVLKASRRITHEQKLRQSSDSVGFFLAAAATLGHKLGPLLFQLPPTFKQDLPLLREFLALLPRERRAAFEFRHPSWFEDGVYEALRAHGAALCTADTGGPDDPPLVATSDWGYLRLRDEGYDDRELGGWAERIKSQPWGETFVFFKHEEQGMGPKLAARFIELAG